MPETRDQQVKQVVEGLALGSVALGANAVSAGKMDLEFAIAHAWRSWSLAARFPSIKGHQAANYIYLGFGRSPRRRMAFAAWESEGAWWYPYITMDDWSVEDCTDILASNGPVDRDGWLELARPFLDHLGDDRVRR